MRQTTAGLTVGIHHAWFCHGVSPVFSGGGARSQPRAPPRGRVPRACPRGVASSNTGAHAGAHDTPGRSARPPAAPLPCVALQDGGVQPGPPPGPLRPSACGAVRPSPADLEGMRNDLLGSPSRRVEQEVRPVPRTGGPLPARGQGKPSRSFVIRQRHHRLLAQGALLVLSHDTGGQCNHQNRRGQPLGEGMLTA